MRNRRYLAAGIAVVLFASSAGFSQSPAERDPQATTARAMAFARDQHPELADLLAKLKNRNEAAFEKAVADLSRAQRRLTRLKERDSDRYELALTMWRLNSRIRLLVARATMSDDRKEIAPRIRKLLQDRQEIRLRMLRLDRERLQERLNHVNEQIARFEEKPEAIIDSQTRRILRDIRGGGSNGARRDGGARKAPLQPDHANRSPDKHRSSDKNQSSKSSNSRSTRK